MKGVINSFGEEVEWGEYWELIQFFNSIGVPYLDLKLDQIRSLFNSYSSCEGYPTWVIGPDGRDWVAFFVTNEDDETAFRAYDDWRDGHDIYALENISPRPWEEYSSLLRDPQTWCSDIWPVETDPVSSCVTSYENLSTIDKSMFRGRTGLVTEEKFRSVVNSLHCRKEELESELGVVNSIKAESDPWIWMSSFEENGLDTMSNDCVIKMTAGQLRELLNK